jgi:valyl-tRNA synthetase
VITEIRNIRSTKNISPRQALTVLVKNSQELPLRSFWPIIQKLGNISEIKFINESPTAASSSFVIKSTEFFIPLEGQIDAEREREIILKDLNYQRGFLTSVEKKLSNEKFISGAPEQVIETERRKKADAEAKIKALEESLKNLN